MLEGMEEGSIIATLTIECARREGKRKRKHDQNSKQNGYAEQQDEEQGLDVINDEEGPAAALANVLRRQIENQKSALYQGITCITFIASACMTCT